MGSSLYLCVWLLLSLCTKILDLLEEQAFHSLFPINPCSIVQYPVKSVTLLNFCEGLLKEWLLFLVLRFYTLSSKYMS